MKSKTLIAKVAVVAAALVLLGAAGRAIAANPGVPAVFDGQAQANVISLITISEDANLDFGRIVAPQSGNQAFTVTPEGAMLPGPGTGQAVGGHQAGQYDITGTPDQSYILTFTFDGCPGAPNLQLNSIFSDALPPTFLNQIDLHVGGTLSMTAPITAGAYQCNYSIQAQYP